MDTNRRNVSAVSDGQYVHRFPAEWRSDEEMLNRLTHAIAVVTDEQPEQVDIGIQRIVDPDSLDRLFTPQADDEDAQLTLLVPDFEISIRADGSFLIVE